jgi:hypothetical protein
MELAVSGVKRGRAPGFRMPDEHRAKIRVTQILKYLGEHMEGLRELSSTQVQAAQILLKKVMPDLAAIEHSGEVKQTFAVSPELPTMEEWEAEFGAPKQLDS